MWLIHCKFANNEQAFNAWAILWNWRLNIVFFVVICQPSAGTRQNQFCYSIFLSFRLCISYSSNSLNKTASGAPFLILLDPGHKCSLAWPCAICDRIGIISLAINMSQTIKLNLFHVQKWFFFRCCAIRNCEYFGDGQTIYKNIPLRHSRSEWMCSTKYMKLYWFYCPTHSCTRTRTRTHFTIYVLIPVLLYNICLFLLSVKSMSGIKMLLFRWLCSCQRCSVRLPKIISHSTGQYNVFFFCTYTRTHTLTTANA